MLVYRNKIAAHYALTDPMEKGKSSKIDNEADKMLSILHNLCHSDNRFWSGQWQMSIKQDNEMHSSKNNCCWSLTSFHESNVNRLWFRALKRRSQRNKLTWDRFGKLVNKWIPRAKILHPYPEERFTLFIQGKSRMR